MLEKVFAISIFAFVLTALLIFAAIRFFPKLGLMDRPLKYGLIRQPIPYYGGIAIFFGFFVSVLLFVPLDRSLLAVLVALFLLVCVNFLDDYFFLSPFLRLFVQIFAGMIVVYGGVSIHSITNPFGLPFSFDYFPFSLGGQTIFLVSALFTIAWVVLLINSMNFLDGVPGLVSGVTFLASVTIFFLSIRPGHLIDQTLVTYLSAILAAVSGAFFLFDFPPPKILMGDTGSVLLGFLIAILAIFSGGKIATAFLVMGFPLLDAVFTIVRRIANGQVPWKGDLQHLHHRFLKAGFSQRQIVLIVCLISALFGGTALFLGTQQKFFALVVLAVLMIAILTSLFFLTRIRSKKS